MTGPRQQVDLHTVIRKTPSGRQVSLAEAAAAACRVAWDKRLGHVSEPWVVDLSSYSR